MMRSSHKQKRWIKGKHGILNRLKLNYNDLK